MPRRLVTKSAELTRLLQESILGGSLAPGTRLPEIRLAKELGVSQSVVRECLQELEALGLIEKRLGGGSQVIRLDENDVFQIYQVRSELESLACALLASSFNLSVESRLRGCLESMEAAGTKNDFTAYTESDTEFHFTIWESQPNRFLERSLRSICLPLFAYDRLRRRGKPAMDYKSVTRQHELILSALRTCDGDRVARLMRRMMRIWLKAHLAEYERTLTIAESHSRNTTDAIAHLGAMYNKTQLL